METPSAPAAAIPTWRAAVLLAAVAAALLALGTRWSWAVSPDGRQLRPRPDALEYVAAAQSIAQTGTYFLQIGPAQVRPRYPPGWPLILAAALRLGVPPESLWRIPGLFAAAQSALLALAAGLACAAVTNGGATAGSASGHRRLRAAEPVEAAAIGDLPLDGAGAAIQPPNGTRWTRVAPAMAALLAGTAWAVAPAAVEVGRTAVSDQAAVFCASLSLLATGAWLLDSRRRGWLWALGGGLAFGLTCGLRPVQALAIAPGVAALLLWGWRRGRAALAPTVAWGAGTLVFPLIVVALLWRSGIPIANWSDYRLWFPQQFSGAAATFGIDNALRGNDEVTPSSDGARTPHLEIGLRVLTGAPGLQEHHYVGQYWPLLGWLCLILLLTRVVRGHRAAAVVAWTVGLVTFAHLAIFSLYFYAAGRFYLLVMAAPIVALGVAAGWLLTRPRWRALAVVLMVVWAGLACAQLESFRSGQRTAWPDEPTRIAFRRWARWSDETRSARVMPFDPVHAQALGLLRPTVIGRIRAWGSLPESQHVRRLRASGVLEYESFRNGRKVTGYEPPSAPD